MPPFLMAFLLGSARLCVALAVFAEPLFDWTKLGFSRLADFRERPRSSLLPVARIVLILTAILITVLTFTHPR